MPVAVGTLPAADVRVGAVRASAVHVGATKVWPPAAPASGLADTILSHDPVAYWPLDPAAPTVDVSGNGWTLTEVGSSKTTGTVGGYPAVMFPGNGNAFTAPGLPAAALAALPAWSVVAFGRAITAGGNRAPFGSWQAVAADRSVLFRSTSATNYAAYWVDGTTQRGPLNVPGDQSTDHMMGVVLASGVGARGFHNGTMTAVSPSSAIMGPEGGGVAPFDVGAARTSGSYWHGPLCHVAVLPVALTQTDVDALLAAFASGT